MWFSSFIIGGSGCTDSMLKILIFIFITHSLSAAEFGGSRASFHRFIMHEFMLEEVSCKVVESKQTDLDKPRIWRARF